MDIQYTISDTLISEANSNVGKVTFGGCAARFNASTGTFAESATIHKLKSLPARYMANNVIGSIAPMFPKSAIPSHRNLLSSCTSHHAKNLLKNFALAGALTVTVS